MAGHYLLPHLQRSKMKVRDRHYGLDLRRSYDFLYLPSGKDWFNHTFWGHSIQRAWRSEAAVLFFPF